MIESEDAVRLARELAAATYESVTRVVTVAVFERLERVRHQESVDARAARIQEISDDAAPRWVEPHRSTDHADLLYDAAGLPR